MSSVSGKTVEVGYATANGTATAGSDYTAGSGTLTFDPGDDEETISVLIKQDGLREDDETFTATLSSPENATLGSIGETTVTIIDDDAPVVSIQSGTSPVTEGTDATYTLSRTGSLAKGLTANVRVSETGAMIDGTAPTTAGFAAGSGTATLTVSTDDDDMDEDDSVIAASIELGSAYKVGTTASAGVKVTDDDTASTAVTLSVSPSSLGEDAGATDLTVTGTLNESARPLATKVSVSLGGATKTLTIPARRTSGSVSVSFTPPDDGVAAPDVTVKVEGSTTVADLSVTGASFEVVEDDAAAWSVTSSLAEISEAGGTSIVTVSTGGVVTFAQDQTLALTASGTATAGADFTVASSLTLTAGATAVTTTLAATSDGVAESTETASIAVSHGGEQIGTVMMKISDGICGRTAKVRDAILGRLSGIDDCALVTASHLSGIQGTLELAKMAIDALKPGDFAGLSALESLDLKGNRLSVLPAGIFDALAALTTLRLQENALTDIPASTFVRLTELTDLQLDKNKLQGLEASDFSGLAKLEILDLEGNRLSALQAGVFDGLAALTTLRLQKNRLTDLPAGIFSGVAAVNTLRIHKNPTDPLPLTVRLQKVGEDQFKAVVPAGAPFAMELPVSVTSGTINGNTSATATIPAGALESSALTVSRATGATSATEAVTVNIGTLPDRPEGHVGYALMKSSDLPLEVLAAEAVLPTLSVADSADVQEGNTTVTFEVTLSGLATGTVTVDYATEDGLAHARSVTNPNGDYEAASGTLTFGDQQRTRTVSVAVYDDAVDEGRETFKLMLSKASGATIADGEAIAAIVNSDPLPQAWLVRFGRTVAGHLIEGVGERLMQSDHVPSQATFARVRLPFGEEASFANAESHALVYPGVGHGLWDPQARFGRAPYGPALLTDSYDAPIGSARELTSRDLLLGSSFVISLGERSGEDARPGWTVWGRGMATRFDGAEAELRLDGEVATYMLGADTVRGGWLGGIALAQSRGEGGYGVSLGGDRTERGNLTSTLTSVHPYVRFRVSERLSAWGALGYGRGALTLDRGAAGTWDTDTSMQMATAGARGVLKPAALTGGFELAIRTDAFWTSINSAASETEAGRLAASEGDVSRLRLILQGARTLTLGGGLTLTPTVELGLRHDTGDAETGTGIELGGGLRFANPAMGLSLEVKARSLIAHQDEEYREWGASASLRLNPGATGSGLMLTLAPSWGVASSGVERLWGQRSAQGLAVNSGVGRTGQLEAEVGYALTGPGGRGMQTPFVALSLGDKGGRTMRVGWRLTLGPQGNLDIEALRRQTENGQVAEHGILLRAFLRW